ncbi:phosphoribosylglycinamide formyltransferase [Candidatus Gottesmanbacteria bacterium]|nr:phosphoribosylglycinamide formyltransferase [Candidatus Gottesmanbacteria bacterium]
MKRIAVLISNKGTGSNLAAIISAIEKKKIKNGRIVVVVSNKSDAFGLQRAQKNKIPTEVLDLEEYRKCGKTRREYDLFLGELLSKKYKSDLIVLAGWMLILSEQFIKYFPNKVINLHPGLLPDGKKNFIKLSNGMKIDAIRGLHTNAAVQYAIDHKFPVTGSTVHFITPLVDQGPVILRSEVKILADDKVGSLYERIKKEEHKILPMAINLYCNNRLILKENKVIII